MQTNNSRQIFLTEYFKHAEPEAGRMEKNLKRFLPMQVVLCRFGEFSFWTRCCTWTKKRRDILDANWTGWFVDVDGIKW